MAEKKDKYAGTMVSDEAIAKSPSLGKGTTGLLVKAGRFLIDKFGVDPNEKKNNPPTGNVKIRRMTKEEKARDESKRFESTKKFANGGKVDFKGNF